MRSYGETRCINQQKPKIANKNEGREEVQSYLLHELPDWLQEFRDNLVDERCPLEPRGNPEPGDRDTSNSSHELPMESRAKVEPGSGKHSVYTHFPKDPKLRYLLEDKNNESFLQKMRWHSGAQSGKIGGLITADHKILSEGSESRNNHRYAVVVQDLATQWLQSYPCKTKTFQETQ